MLWENFNKTMRKKRLVVYLKTFVHLRNVTPYKPSDVFTDWTIYDLQIDKRCEMKPERYAF